MARNKTNVERNTFIKGLITEAGPLTFPENASKDELNMVLNKDGSRQRRLGIDYEVGYALKDTGITTVVVDDTNINSYRWDNVGNDARISIGVIQVKDKLWFLDMAANAPSASLLNGGNAVTIPITIDRAFSFASINGVLVVVGEGIDKPIYLSYNQTADTITQTVFDIEVRDIWGVTDNLAIDERPTTLTDKHKYNLLNQGWDNTKINSFFTSQSKYPSNADIWHIGKDSSDNFDPALLVKQDFGTAKAAQGRFIIEAFSRGAERQAATSISGLPTDEEAGNVSTVASFAGRIFYSGVRGNITGPDKNSPAYSGTVFFSQIIDSNSKLGFCYQAGDPTAEFNADLVANDGGTIQIPEAAAIVKLIAKEDTILVFAENGVWLIQGSNGGFFADEVSVRKITNVGTSGPESIVDVDGTVIYWAKGGIYQLTPDPRSGRLVAQNITERTIQTRYNEIGAVGRLYAKGTFDGPSRRVKWLYNDSVNYDGKSRVNAYNKELTLDLVLGAFSISDIRSVTNGPYVAGHLQTSAFVNAEVDDLVLVGSDIVQVGTENVGVLVTARSRGTSATKYVTIIPDTTSKFTLSFYNNGDFLDWETFDGTGVDAAAYLLTGEELFGDTQRSKGVSYITTHMLRTESGFFLDGSGNLQALNPSSCKVQARWDFSDSATSGKFGSQFQVYRLKRNYIPTGVGDPFDYGQEVITTKSKLRGTGKALTLRFDSEPGKDLYLYGWALSVEGNTVT